MFEDDEYLPSNILIALTHMSYNYNLNYCVQNSALFVVPLICACVKFHMKCRKCTANYTHYSIMLSLALDPSQVQTGCSALYFIEQ